MERTVKSSKSSSLHVLVDAVAEELMLSGELADLGHANMETIENEVLQNMDELTQRVISRLLSKQAELMDEPSCCPKCQGPLSKKPAQGRSLQSLRGRVHFQCDAYRCEACRLDFFPSIQSARL